MSASIFVMFSTYLELGFKHILDLNAYDHILFVVALCAVYRLREWRTILWLVTAFTLGHCITLVLSGLEIININAQLVETLIPITIIITAGLNIIGNSQEKKLSYFSYAITAIFGLIHGLGFSNQFKAFLGQNDNIIDLLLPFNVGVELGQLVIVAATMFLSYIAMSCLKIKQKYWVNIISGLAIGIAIILLRDVLTTT